MNKDKIKEKVLKNGKEIYLSAQAYNVLTNKERQALKDALKDEGLDPDEYEVGMKKLWPREVHLKPLVWRRR